MIPLIQQAILFGYAAKEILNFFGSKDPKLGTGIKNARSIGYRDEDILKFIEGKLNVKNKPAAEKKATDLEKYYKESGFKTKEERQETKRKAIKGALGVAGAGLTAYRMYQGYQGGIGNLLEKFKQEAPSPQEKVPEEQAAQQPMQMPIESPSSTSIPQMPDQEEQQTIQNIFDSLTKDVDFASLPQSKQPVLNFYKLIADKLQQEGKSLEDPAVKSLGKKIQKELKKEPSFGEIESERFKKGYLEQEIKNPIITTEGNFGDLKSQSGKNALIEENGKIQKVKEDQLIKSPISYKELSKLYTDLIGGIESFTGKQVSRNVNLVGYSEEDNQLAYTPHGGETYIYDDIPKEIAEELKKLLPRKTSGQNFIGAWEQGTESPIGAQISALIQRLIKERRTAGKKEYSAKFKQIYDAFKPAIEAVKRVKKEEREEEKRRKKKGK